jgi:hypothetical protein
MLLCSHVRKILFLIFTLSATIPPIYPLYIKYFFIPTLHLLSICYQLTTTRVRNIRLSTVAVGRVRRGTQVGGNAGKPMREEGGDFCPLCEHSNRREEP